MARPPGPPAADAHRYRVIVASPTERAYVPLDACPRALPNVSVREDAPVALLAEIAALAEAAAHNTAVALKLTEGKACP